MTHPGFPTLLTGRKVLIVGTNCSPFSHNQLSGNTVTHVWNLQAVSHVQYKHPLILKCSNLTILIQSAVKVHLCHFTAMITKSMHLIYQCLSVIKYLQLQRVKLQIMQLITCDCSDYKQVQSQLVCFTCSIRFTIKSRIILIPPRFRFDKTFLLS